MITCFKSIKATKPDINTFTSKRRSNIVWIIRLVWTKIAREQQSSKAWSVRFNLRGANELPTHFSTQSTLTYHSREIFRLVYLIGQFKKYCLRPRNRGNSPNYSYAILAHLIPDDSSAYDIKWKLDLSLNCWLNLRHFDNLFHAIISLMFGNSININKVQLCFCFASGFDSFFRPKCFWLVVLCFPGPPL